MEVQRARPLVYDIRHQVPQQCGRQTKAPESLFSELESVPYPRKLPARLIYDMNTSEKKAARHLYWVIGTAEQARRSPPVHGVDPGIRGARTSTVAMIFWWGCNLDRPGSSLLLIAHWHLCVEW